jgi:hypothetical protein
MVDNNIYDDGMIPFFGVASRDFDKDLIILKKVLYQFEQRTHSENAYKFSQRATLLAAVDGGFMMYSLNVILSKRFFR